MKDNNSASVIDRGEYKTRIKSAGGAFLFCGEEEYLKNIALRESRSIVSTDESTDVFNIITISFADSSDALKDVEAALASPPMFAERKLVILRDYNLDSANVRENAIKDLCALAEAVDADTTIFILYCFGSEFTLYNGKNLTSKASSLGKVFDIVDFEQQTGAKLTNWMEKHFASLGVNAGSQVCQMLIDRCGHSMGILANEIDKLSHYVLADGRREVTPTDINTICAEYTEYGAFELTDAILAKNTKRAYEIFRQKKAEKEEPILIVGMLTKLFCDLYYVCAYGECELDSKQISAETKIHEFVVNKYRNFITRYSLDTEKLGRKLGIIADCDRKIKGYTADGYEQTERMMIELIEEN